MGFLHCDLKPENVLVSGSGRPAIADFETSKEQVARGDVGGASLTATATVTRVVVGGQYSAPEVILRGHSRGSDMYAFGVMLAEALLGPDAIKVAPGGQASSALVALSRPGVASRLDAEQRSLLARLLAADRSHRPSAAELLLSPFFRGRPRLRRCCICLESFPLGKGLECGRDVVAAPGAGSAADQDAGVRERHFTCADCFTQHVSCEASAELGAVRVRGGRVYCPKWSCRECVAGPFSDGEIAGVASGDAFGAYVRCRLRLAEAALASRMEREKAEAVGAELRRLAALDERGRRVAAACARVRELLNDACPRCGAVFGGFDGCAALTCGRCRAGFCAWCLADCGADAHAHVARCGSNLAPGRSVFAEAGLVEEGRLRRRRGGVTELLRALEPEVRAEAARSVRRELADVGLADVADLFGGGSGVGVGGAAAAGR